MHCGLSSLFVFYVDGYLNSKFPLSQAFVLKTEVDPSSSAGRLLFSLKLVLPTQELVCMQSLAFKTTGGFKEL